MSVLTLGTSGFGSKTDKSLSFKMLDMYQDVGGNSIDTARMYAQWIPNGLGLSESVIGEWLKGSGCRDKIIISTKGGHPPFNDRSISRLSRSCLENDLSNSLKALCTDYIDIYFLHKDDNTTRVEDIMDVLGGFVVEGKVRHIGCSNWSCERIKKANAYARTLGLPLFEVNQLQWSLAKQMSHSDPTVLTMDDNSYHWHISHKMPVMAFSSQAKGFFSKLYLYGESGLNQKARQRFLYRENFEIYQQAVKVAKEKKCSITEVVLGYITNNKLVSSAIIGCRNEKQLKDSLSASDTVLTQNVIDQLRGFEYE